MSRWHHAMRHPVLPDWSDLREWYVLPRGAGLRHWHYPRLLCRGVQRESSAWTVCPAQRVDRTGDPAPPTLSAVAELSAPTASVAPRISAKPIPAPAPPTVSAVAASALQTALPASAHNAAYLAAPALPANRAVTEIARTEPCCGGATRRCTTDTDCCSGLCTNGDCESL